MRAMIVFGIVLISSSLLKLHFRSKALPNVAAQVIKDTNKALQGLGQPHMTSDQKESLTAQIVDLANPDNRIRKILSNDLRLRCYWE